LKRQGNKGKANGRFQKAVELSPKLVEMQSKFEQSVSSQRNANEGTVLSYKDVQILEAEDSYKYFLKKIQNNPDDLSYYYKALQIKPTSGTLYLQLGNALVRKNKFNEAIVIYKIVFKVDPDSANAADAYDELKKCLFEVQSV
jgi:tetratricopeptide (TPR) repeat protein